jgi:hypothetical protein
VRNLDLQAYGENEDCHWFNSEQCAALCNSRWGRQCEVLRVQVENEMDALQLVYLMPSLRALIIQILNDERNTPEFESSSMYDELVEWLLNSLDYTCAVARHESDPRFIQLWVR